MLNVAGYAESYRAGRITIIDTLPMSRQWDPGAVPTNEHPYGDNTLDAYAKRQAQWIPPTTNATWALRIRTSCWWP